MATLVSGWGCKARGVGSLHAEAVHDSQCDGASWDSVAAGGGTGRVTVKTVAQVLRAPRAGPSTLLRTVSLSNRLTTRLGDFATNSHEYCGLRNQHLALAHLSSPFVSPYAGGLHVIPVRPGLVPIWPVTLLNSLTKLRTFFTHDRYISINIQ